MKEEQEKFTNFILEKVPENKKEDAMALLADYFKKQEDGTFTKNDISIFASKIIIILKPEAIEEVQTVMKQFSHSII